jgi:WD40 repeat protein
MLRGFILLILTALASSGVHGEGPPLRTDFYGDPLPRGAIARMGTNRFADVIEGDAVLLSPDGTTIVLRPIWNDPLMHVCDATTGRVLYKLVDSETTKGREVKVFGFSPDNRLLALAIGDQISLREQHTGKVVHTLAEKVANIQGGLFASDGKLFAAWSKNGDVWLWDTATGHLRKSLSTPKKDGEALIALSGDLTKLARCLDGHEVTLWDLPSGTIRRTLPKQDRTLRRLVFSFKGNVLVAASSFASAFSRSGNADRSTIHCFSMTDGQEVRIESEHHFVPRLMAVSPDGKFVAAIRSGHQEVVDVWSLHSGEYLAALQGGFPQSNVHWGIECLAFTHDSRKLAIGGDRRVWLYDVESKRPLHEWYVANTHIPTDMCFTADDRVLAVREEGTVAFLDVTNGGWMARPPRHTRDVRHLTFSADGRKLASGGLDGTIRVWNAVSGEQIQRLQDDGEWLENLAISSDGRKLASVGSPPSARVCVWNPPQPRPSAVFIQQFVLMMFGKGFESEEFCFSEDGNLLVLTSSGRKTIDFCDTRRGELVARLAYGVNFGSIALSPDGLELAVRTQSAIDLLDVKTKAVMRKISQPRPTVQLQYTWDGRYLIGCAEDRVHVWELATLREAFSWRDSNSSVLTPGYTADGRILLLGRVTLSTLDHRYSVTGTWPAAKTFTLPEDFRCPIGCCFSPRAQRLATGTYSGEILVWDLRSLLEKPPATVLAPAEMDLLRADLAGEDAARAYQASRRLIAAPAAAVGYIREHLVPGPLNNASAIIAALDDRSFKVREEAQKDLDALEAGAEPAILAALARKPSLETRTRLEAQLAKIRMRPQPAEKLRATRSIAILEYIATRDADALVQSFARGRTDSWITNEAQKAVKRMNAGRGLVP